MKILNIAKLLDVHLQVHVTALVHQNQTGFMVGRKAWDNTIQALHLLHWVQYGPDRMPCVILSMDAEKAFDRVHWTYIVELLWGLGLYEQMLGWILASYHKPRAQAKVNGMLSDYFSIGNWTRQGCPLFLLLFALVLEPFLRMVRNNMKIVGIHISSTEHKLSVN